MEKILLQGPPAQYVKLNVGGHFFTTTIGTLCGSDTMLRAMFSGKMEVLTDADGWVLIDRNGAHFGRILNWLRDGDIPLPESREEIEELAMEAKYFLCETLLQKCEAALCVGREPEPSCRVPYVTSLKEEQQIVAATKKPVIKLQINRHNNKYSYTSTSDDNFLKSLELFDKLAIRFNGRLLFLKDVIGLGSSEICCWSFYGNYKKVAEVCCTSIVYTSDKGKHIKVEFPEARILEETLNALLYERPYPTSVPSDSATGIDGRRLFYLAADSDDDDSRSGPTYSSSMTATTSNTVSGATVASLSLSNHVGAPFQAASGSSNSGAAGSSNAASRMTTRM